MLCSMIGVEAVNWSGELSAGEFVEGNNPGVKSSEELPGDAEEGKFVEELLEVDEGAEELTGIGEEGKMLEGM